MTPISNFITAFKAEQIKKKGTGFYWTSAIMGILAPILYGAVTISQDSPEIKAGIPYNYFLQFIENSMLPFASFFFPLLIIITISRITQLDHRNGGWQLMETQPGYKFSIYFSKFCTVLFANLIAILSFMVFSVLAAWMLTYIVTIPKMAAFELPLAEIGWIVSRLFVGSLLITAIQFTISVLISSFIWSILIGFFGLLVMLFLAPFNMVPSWYPYEILSKIAASPKGSELGYWFTYTDRIGLIASVSLLYLGFRWYQNKNFKAAFLNKPVKTSAALAVIAVSAGMMYWLLKPNQMPQMNRTTLSGKIESDQKLQKAYLIDYIIQDTIAEIPLQDNAFKYVFEKPVVSDYYALVFDGKFNTNIYFSSKDSIFIEGKIFENQSDFKVKGTRLAENQVPAENQFEWSMAEYYINQNDFIDQPEKIAAEIYSEWKDARKESQGFRTIDNYIAKQDFADRSKKLASVKYLNLWNSYLKKRTALLPDKKTNEGEEISEIKASLSLTDESLLSTPDYFNYLRSRMIMANKDDLSDNTKALLAISKLQGSSFKDKMLFWQLKKSIGETNATQEREALLSSYGKTFSDARYQNQIVAINKVVESLGRGKEAPQFDAVSIDKKAVSLSDLKGKFVIIDVWATWCGPCREQSPYFEKYALKYKKENIQFVALSTDENTGKWFIEAKTKSKSVLQLHSNDHEKFGRDYSVESIPRFILIGPDGKFINARLPFPEYPAFEDLLRKELGLSDEK